MTPEQALQILDEVTAQQPMVRNQQNLVQQALLVLKMFIEQHKSKETPKK